MGAWGQMKHYGSHKLIAPPICRAVSAEATFHPFSPKVLRGIKVNATRVPKTVLNAPVRNAMSNDPASRTTRFRSESNKNRGTASGTRTLFTNWSFSREVNMRRNSEFRLLPRSAKDCSITHKLMIRME